MRTARPRKAFDCIKYKRRVQARIYRETRGLTPEQQIEYFEQAARTGPLGEWWSRVRKVSARSTPGTRSARQKMSSRGRSSG